MQFAATFVEYLITGTISLLWLLPVLAILQPHLPRALHQDLRPPEAWAVILLVGVYVVGLLLDFVAYKIMRKIRKLIRVEQQALNDEYDEVIKTSAVTVWGDHAFIWTYAPELAKTLEAYSTRDRIARGLVLNLWIAAAVYPFFAPSWIERISYVVGFVALSWVAYLAWFRFQSLSRELKKHAVMTIVAKTNHAG